MVYSKLAVFSAVMAMVFGAPVSSDSSGVITVPLQKVRESKHDGNLTRRALPDQPLDYTGYRYFADYTIAGQKQSAILDTGSSDTFTFTSSAWSGGFNLDKSSTWKWQNDDFVAAFGDGTNKVTGSWGTDTVGVGGAEVANYPVGILNHTYASFPDNRAILGFGPKAAETASTKYPTYAERLKDAGQIQSNSFSIYSDESNTEATLLIGGIDTAKFKAPLYTLPFDVSAFSESYYYSVDFEYDGTSYSDAVLDTGTAYVLLPDDVATSVANQYGFQWSNDYGAFVSSSKPSLPDFDFKIGGITVTVPGSQAYYEDGGEYVFGISTNQLASGTNILGDPILRQLFLFFDIDQNEVAFAPVVQTDASSPTAVGSSIPESTPAPDQGSGGDSGWWW